LTTKPIKRSSVTATAFWDTSAIVPLCCFQGASAKARQAVRAYGQQVVWWVTPIEATSALQRLKREGHLSAKDGAQFLARLQYLRTRWNEVQPSEDLRFEAERLLRMYALRAADALQLAAGLVWCNSRPVGHIFIAADGALADAAGLEGFSVTQL
jgi:predicted nucleic acid-binding protein